jgi:uncharacterized membrane protein
MPSSTAPSSRLASIDQLRGSVMLLMLLDHVRETFYLHQQVSDPMDVATVSPALYLSRLLAHLCAPAFVLLTGLSAWLYGQRQADPRRAAAVFLAKRGLFLIVLELSLVSFAWSFEFPPQTLYLQVIWAIGLSMLALAALLWLPRPLLALLGLALVAGHNLLDGLRVEGDGVLAILWKVLHQRDWIVLSDQLRLRTSYPLLPWIGVIALGYVMGPWYGGLATQVRQRRLLGVGLGALVAFALLRLWNGYGDQPWTTFTDPLRSVMSFFNVTKYPPSLLFLLLTLGIVLVLLRAFEWPPLQRQRWLALFGAAPMFFYLLHLYVLKLMQLGAQAAWGANHDGSYGFDSITPLWVCTLLLAVALYWPVRAFAQFKARRRDLAWLRYL